LSITKSAGARRSAEREYAQKKLSNSGKEALAGALLEPFQGYFMADIKNKQYVRHNYASDSGYIYNG
jgi:hypothetical protein